MKVESPAASLKRAQAKAKRHALEDAFALQIRQYGLPEPEREVLLVPGRKFRIDFCFREYSTVVEVNGGTWNIGGHSSGPGIQRDYDKNNELNILGYCVLTFSGDDVKSGRGLEMLKRALKIHEPIPF